MPWIYLASYVVNPSFWCLKLSVISNTDFSIAPPSLYLWFDLFLILKNIIIFFTWTSGCIKFTNQIIFFIYRLWTWPWNNFYLLDQNNILATSFIIQSFTFTNYGSFRILCFILLFFIVILFILITNSIIYTFLHLIRESFIYAFSLFLLVFVFILAIIYIIYTFLHIFRGSVI